MMEERKLCKSKSDLGHFVNIKWMWTAYCAFGFVDLTIKIEKTTARQQSNEKSTRSKWTTAVTNASECVCVCVKMPDSRIGSNKSQFSLWKFGCVIGARVRQWHTTQSDTIIWLYIVWKSKSKRVSLRRYDGVPSATTIPTYKYTGHRLVLRLFFFLLSILCQLLHHLAI